MKTLSFKTGADTHQILPLLGKLYPQQNPAALWAAIEEKAAPLGDRITCQREKFPCSFSDDGRKCGLYLDESSVFFITYADIIACEGASPLENLRWFMDRRLSGTFSHIHILPFYPSTSDDGFSVADYSAVDPRLGTWRHINDFAGAYGLMFDAVINHISASSAWFLAFLQGDERYQGFFIEAREDVDYSIVTRPRTSPLFTKFRAAGRDVRIWTTFSADQVDLDFRNWHVLLEIIAVLLGYVAEGASVIRLDAASYLWKQEGTDCSNLEQCHTLVQLLRAVLDIYAPWVILITETNVTHSENIRYLGNGTNEAQLVYQFALPPLVAYSFISRSTGELAKWARSLTYGGQTSYLNFLSSHDGVGLVPVSTILTQSQVDAMIAKTRQSGGFVSYKSGPGGQSIPYELNCTYYELIAEPQLSGEENIRRFITSQSILLALKGVPAIYYHSLLGSRNNTQEAEATGSNRRVNRRKFTRPEVEALLEDPQSHSAKVLEEYTRLIGLRRQNRAFHPQSGQQILDLHPGVFAVLRHTDAEHVLCLANTSLDKAEIPLPAPLGDGWHIIAGDSAASCACAGRATLAGSGFLWLSSGTEGAAP